MSGMGGGKPGFYSKPSRKIPRVLEDDENEKLRKKIRKQRERIRQLEDELFEVTVLVPPLPEKDVDEEKRA
jgi:hypothetical protein